MQKADPALKVSKITRKDGVDGATSVIWLKDIVNVCGVDATRRRDGEGGCIMWVNSPSFNGFQTDLLV